jgi:hypothetical protein
MRTSFTAHIPATEITGTVRHCDHDDGSRSFAVGGKCAANPTYISAANPNEMIDAADRLKMLAAEWMMDLDGGEL